MRILLYNPDNGVTRNFMVHLWMFLLKALTPAGHDVLLIDGNAQPMDEPQIAEYVREQNVGLVGIGAMTRMIAKAYRIGDAIRATGVPVVMGGPHATELADEALGRDGGPRHADAVALGEADETWPQIVNDAVNGQLKEKYAPIDDLRKERKPSLKRYPVISWDSIDLDQFNLVPKSAAALLRKVGEGWGTFRIVPEPFGYRLNIFLARLCFRGIYFPMMGKVAWLKVAAQNRRTILKLVKEAFFGRRTLPPNPAAQDAYGVVAAPDVHGEVSV